MISEIFLGICVIVTINCNYLLVEVKDEEGPKEVIPTIGNGTIASFNAAHLLRCRPPGGHCSRRKRCCSGKCSRGKCTKLPGPNRCSPLGNGCRVDRHCCTKHCNRSTRKCAHLFRCQPPGRHCSRRNICCSGRCRRGKCTKRPVPNRCSPLGKRCRFDRNCCTKHCDRRTRKCGTVGRYSKGELGTNCPLGQIVASEQECIKASMELGLNYRSAITLTWHPAGCYYFRSDSDVFFNQIIDPSSTFPQVHVGGICKDKGCSNDHHTCDSGECIMVTWKCDGYNDCEDWSDEKDCSVGYTKLKNRYCDGGYDLWLYRSLYQAKAMCTADAGCAAVYDWGCAGNTLGLCRINYRQRPSTKPPLSCLHHKYVYA